MILDTHVHLRDGAQNDKETIFHAFLLARQFGVHGLIEMPNTSPPLLNRQAVEQRMELVWQASERLCQQGHTPPNYAMHVGIAIEASDADGAREVARQAAALIYEFPQVVGLKMYAGHSTGNLGITERDAQQQVYAALAQMYYNGILVLHCEQEDCIDNSRFDPADPTSHSLARPVEAELRSIEQQLELARCAGFGGQLHIAHISTPEGVELVQQAKRRGHLVSCGVTPHHCLLNLDHQRQLSATGKGNLLKVNPPLRDPERQQALWRLLCNGQIDWIESDHAPHAPAEKSGQNGQAVASGIPGFSGMNLLYWRLRRSGMTAELLEDLCWRRALVSYRLPWAVADFFQSPIHQKLRSPGLSPHEIEFDCEPAEVDLASFCESDGGPLYGGVDPYPQLFGHP